MDRPEPDAVLTAEPPAAPAEAPVQRLDPRAVTLWRLTGALWWAFWTACMIIPWLLWEWPLALMIPVAALGVAWTVWVPAASYRHFTYQVGDVDVRVMHGWWTRRVAVVLHSRIQHVDTRQGPVERALGLATVVIYTAGSMGAMVGIPGLAEGDAEALRDRLAHLSGTDDAV
jgi:hypothetical protein